MFPSVQNSCMQMSNNENNDVSMNPPILPQVTELSSNPFQGSSNSTQVRSKPLSLVVKGSDGNVIAVEGLSSPIDVLLPQEKSVQVIIVELKHESFHSFSNLVKQNKRKTVKVVIILV